MKKYILLMTLISGLISSCETDFEVNAPYKETTVIYGLLNAVDSVQYIRVSKGFLGEGDALIMAQNSDSINYPDILDVRLERVLNDVVQESFSLERVDTIPKEEGIFAYPHQVYYKLKNHIIDGSSFYRIVVKNTQTNHTASSLSRIVNDITVINPSSSDVDFSTPAQFSVKFIPGANGRIYDLVIRYHYTETDNLGVMSVHYVDWNFSDQFTTSTSEIAFPYYRPDFFVFLGREIPVKSGVVRRVDNLPAPYKAVEFRMIAGSEDLHTYQQLNSPSNTSLQEPPLFTTVENGIGLFTSRLIHSEFRNMNQRTKDSILVNQYTKDLGFQF